MIECPKCGDSKPLTALYARRYASKGQSDKAMHPIPFYYCENCNTIFRMSLSIVHEKDSMPINKVR